MIRVLRHFERAASGYIVDYIVLDDLTVNTSYCKDYAVSTTMDRPTGLYE